MLKRPIGTRHQGASIALGVEPVGINDSLNVALHAAYLLAHTALRQVQRTFVQPIQIILLRFSAWPIDRITEMC